MAKAKTTALPPDNGARIALYDAMCELAGSNNSNEKVISPDQLFEQVIGRLRILVPRELHLAGERAYFDEKLEVCIESGLAARASGGVVLGDTTPIIQYPDGKAHTYQAGLNGARARLERDDAALRRAGFDVRKLVRSVADAPRSPEFKRMVASMQEHGYLKQFPVVVGADGEIVDGRARAAAAALAGVTVVGMSDDDRLPNRLDTPLHRTILVLAVNAGRVAEDVREQVLEMVSEKTGRAWKEIESDLLITREWRRAVPRSYVASFEVEDVPFRPDEPEPTIPITVNAPARVGLRKLIEAVGLSNYKIQTELRGHVVEELARTQLTSKPAIFVEVSNAIEGIAHMQAERRRKKLKLDPQWELARQWLIDWAGRARAADAEPDDAVPSDQPVGQRA
jgi:hypothetical protein